MGCRDVDHILVFECLTAVSGVEMLHLTDALVRHSEFLCFSMNSGSESSPVLCQEKKSSSWARKTHSSSLEEKDPGFEWSLFDVPYAICKKPWLKCLKEDFVKHVVLC